MRVYEISATSKHVNRSRRRTVQINPVIEQATGDVPKTVYWPAFTYKECRKDELVVQN